MACFGAKQTPVQFGDLAMQKQPTSRLDLNHSGHFLSRLDTMDVVIGDSAFTDLHELPSSNDVDTEKIKKKLKAKCGEKVSSDSVLKS